MNTGYIYIFDRYCFNYDQFVNVMKLHLDFKVLYDWLAPLLIDGILLKWLLALKDEKAIRLIKMIEAYDLKNNSVNSLIKRICLELDLS